MVDEYFSSRKWGEQMYSAGGAVVRKFSRGHEWIKIIYNPINVKLSVHFVRHPTKGSNEDSIYEDELIWRGTIPTEMYRLKDKEAELYARILMVKDNNTVEDFQEEFAEAKEKLGEVEEKQVSKNYHGRQLFRLTDRNGRVHELTGTQMVELYNKNLAQLRQSGKEYANLKKIETTYAAIFAWKHYFKARIEKIGWK
jgi:hypothetical protein